MAPEHINLSFWICIVVTIYCLIYIWSLSSDDMEPFEEHDDYNYMLLFEISLKKFNLLYFHWSLLILTVAEMFVFDRCQFFGYDPVLNSEYIFLSIFIRIFIAFILSFLLEYMHTIYTILFFVIFYADDSENPSITLTVLEIESFLYFVCLSIIDLNLFMIYLEYI